MMPCSEASSPTRANRASSGGELVADDRAEPVEQRLGRDAGRLGADDARVEEQHEQARDDERAAGPEAGLRDVAHGVVRLLGGERQLLDAEEEPHGERQGEQDRQHAVRQELGLARVRARCPTGSSHWNAPENSAMSENTRMMPIEMIETTIANLNEIAAPAALSAMNDDVEDDPPHPGGHREVQQLARDRVGVRRGEVHDDRGRGDVLDRLGGAGDRGRPTAPSPSGRTSRRRRCAASRPPSRRSRRSCRST